MRAPSALLHSVLMLAAGLFCSETASGADLHQLTLPPGFQATVVAPSLGRGARHLAVRSNGDLYVRFLRSRGGGIAALRDTSGDGIADTIQRFEKTVGTGIHIHEGYLYFSSDTALFRQKLTPDKLVPSSPVEQVVRGFPDQGSHRAKAFDFDDSGNVYIDSGAPSNACQKQRRTKGSPGQNPCPQLVRGGGIWRFELSRGLGQTQLDHGHRFATGARHSVALAWHPAYRKLYACPHGRDQLHSLFPEYYSIADNAELPSEELHLVVDGSNMGWPYSYWDHRKGLRVKAPEYGGDGRTAEPNPLYQKPILGFPGHWAPNDLLVYTGSSFPSRYKNGLLIAFHGSWNRAPLPQQGYKVVFVPLENGSISGGYEVFADGFAGTKRIESPGHARFRPMGLAQGPDGSVYVSDSSRGRIWKIQFRSN